MVKATNGINVQGSDVLVIHVRAFKFYLMKESAKAAECGAAVADG